LFFLLGVHPADGHLADEDEWPLLRQAFRNDGRLKAVGEIGLDFHWKDCPRDTQARIFREQLRIARETDRPVVIHCRDAFQATLDILDEEGFKGRPLLWHCFGGDAAMAGAVLRRGWHISLPGPVTFPANQALRDAVREIPHDRILLETDCPYLAPHPWRGRRNEPALSVFTAAAVAKAMDIPAETLWELCGRNARDFFDL
jgi:TatD DNase family protein